MLVSRAEKPKRLWCIFVSECVINYFVLLFLIHYMFTGLGSKISFFFPAGLLALGQLSSEWCLLFLFFCSLPFCFMLYFFFVPVLVAAGFAPWRYRPHRVRPHIHSTSDQVLKSYLSVTEKKRQQCAYDEKSHTNMFISCSLIHWRRLAANSK